jgi:YD repeat-containing protein
MAAEENKSGKSPEPKKDGNDDSSRQKEVESGGAAAAFDSSITHAGEFLKEAKQEMAEQVKRHQFDKVVSKVSQMLGRPEIVELGNILVKGVLANPNQADSAANPKDPGHHASKETADARSKTGAGGGNSEDVKAEKAGRSGQASEPAEPGDTQSGSAEKRPGKSETAGQLNLAEDIFSLVDTMGAYLSGSEGAQKNQRRGDAQVPGNQRGQEQAQGDGEQQTLVQGEQPGKGKVQGQGERQEPEQGKDGQGEKQEPEQGKDGQRGKEQVKGNGEQQLLEVGTRVSEMLEGLPAEAQSLGSHVTDGLTNFMKSIPSLSGVELGRDPRTGEPRITVNTGEGTSIPMPGGAGNLEIGNKFGFNLGWDKDGPKLTNIEGMNTHLQGPFGLSLKVPITEAGASIENNQFGLKVKTDTPLGAKDVVIPLAHMPVDTGSRETSTAKEPEPEPGAEPTAPDQGAEQIPPAADIPLAEKGAKETAEAAVTDGSAESRTPDDGQPVAAPDKTKAPERKTSEKSIASTEPEGAEEQKATADRIQMPDGSERTFERSPDGKVTRIAESGSGMVWTSQDGQTFTQKDTGETIKGQLKIEPDGTYKITSEKGVELSRNKDGTSTISDQTGQMNVNLDGSRVLTDTKGNVTATVDVKGQQRSIERGENGEITKFTEPDKTQWLRLKQNQWKNAQTGDILNAELNVDKNGDFNFKQADGRETTQRLDGSSVARDSKGRVSAVLGPDGKVTEFEHDDKNNVTRMKNPDGTAWQKQGDHWQKEGTTETWKGERTVAKDGAIHLKTESGETIRRTDGWEEKRDQKGNLQTIERDNPNGSHVVKDAQGHITELRDKNGKSLKLEYNKDGQPTSHETPSGATWKSEDGLNWTRQGTSPPENWTGRVHADENGNYREVSQAGTERVHKGDGSFIAASSGKITETATSDGKVHKYGYDEKGNLNSVQYPNADPPGSAWKTEDGKTWNKFDQDGNKVGEPWKGSIKLRADGTRAEFNETTGNTTISRTDGSEMVRDSEGKLLKANKSDGSVFDSKVGLTETKGKDGSHVMTDAQGHVTKVVGADGKTREYGYHPSGKLNHVHDSSGDWSTKDGVNWVKDNGKDQPPSTFKGTIEVQPDGTQKERSAESGAETYKKPDGKTVTVENGGTRVADKDGRILETVDKGGNKRQFEYNSEGKLTKTVEGNTVWNSSNGVDWTNQDGAKRQGVSIVNPDGSTTDISLKGHQTVRKLDGTTTESERTDLAETAQVLRDTLALKGEKYDSKWRESDRLQVIREQLEKKTVTAAETQVIASMFKEKWGDGSSMEDVFKKKLSGANQDEAVNLLRREDGPDGKIKDDSAGKIHQAVIERGQWVDGRRDEACEEDVRKRLSNMNSSQIADLREKYARKFGEDGGPAGKDLDSSLKNMKKSEFTEKSMEVYLKGTDSKTRDADMKMLMDLAAKEGNLDHFKEVSGLASAKARQDFVNDDGSRKIVEAFRSINPLSKQNDITHAVEFVKDGKLSEATQIRDHTHTFSNDEKEIEDVLAKMPQEKRDLYMRGKHLSEHQDEINTPQDKSAVGFYDNLHGAIKDTHTWGKEFKAEGLEDQVRFKGGSLMKDQLAQGGVLWAGSNQEILSGIEKMDRQQWDKLTTQPGYADDLKKSMGDALGHQGMTESLLGPGEKYKRASELIDQKLKMADDLRNMSESDLRKQPHFDKLKDEDFKSAAQGQKLAQQLEAEKDPTKRNALEQSLKPEDKVALEKYRDASYNAVAAGARRPVIDALNDNVHTFGNNRREMLDAIEHMTPAEQERYRKNPGDLNNKVKEVLGTEGSAANDAAMGMLNKVMKGEQPTMGIKEKLNALAMDRSDKADVIKELQGALKNDPKALEKLKNDPDFDKAARRAIGDNEYSKNYDTFVKPMIEKGRLPAEAMVQLHEQMDENGQPMVDRKALAKDVIALSPDALKSLNKPENSAEKDLLLKSLTPEDAKLAKNAIEQGGLNAEDKMRAFVLGSGISKEEMKETLSHMKLEDRQTLFVDYSGKYGAELKRDLMQQSDGEDKAEVDRLSRTHAVTASQEFSLAIDKSTRSDGYGGVVMDRVFGYGGSRDMMKGSLTEFNKSMQDASAQFKELPPERQEELAKNFEKSLRSYQESKEEFANTVVDTAIMVGATVGAPFTGGASLYPLLYGGMAAAALKTGTKAMVMGEDYDSSVSGISRDLATGFASGATSFLGPAHAGALFGVGEKAGAAAAEATIATLAKDSLSSEAKEFLSKSMQGVLRDALVHGTGGVEEKALANLAGQLVEKGMLKEAEQAALTKTMSETLNSAIQNETKSFLKNQAMQYSLNALAMGTGNAANAVTDGIFTGDLSPDKIGTQMLHGALSGAFMTGGFKGMGSFMEWKGVQAPLAHSLGSVFAGAGASGLSTLAGAAITGDTVSAGDFFKATAQGGIGAVRLEGAAWRLKPEHPHGVPHGEHTGSGKGPHETTTPNETTTRRESAPQAEGTPSAEALGENRDEHGKQPVKQVEQDATKSHGDDAKQKERQQTPEVRETTPQAENKKAFNQDIQVTERDGNVVKLRRGLGSAELEYGADGEPSKVKFSSGKTIERTGPDEYAIKAGPRAQPEIVKGKLEIQPDGSIKVGNSVDAVRTSLRGVTERNSSPEDFMHLKSGSKEFHKEVAAALSEIPQQYRDLVEKNGARIVAASEPTEIDPNQKREAHYTDLTKVIAVAEQHKLADGTVVKTDAVAGTVRHEFGHALDDALGHFGETREFKDAYFKDKMNMQDLTEAEKKEIGYYLQPGHIGRSEAFAELFAINQGGGASEGSRALMEKAFPETMKAIRERLAQIDRGSDTDGRHAGDKHSTEKVASTGSDTPESPRQLLDKYKGMLENHQAVEDFIKSNKYSTTKAIGLRESERGYTLNHEQYAEKVSSLLRQIEQHPESFRNLSPEDLQHIRSEAQRVSESEPAGDSRMGFSRTAEAPVAVTESPAAEHAADTRLHHQAPQQEAQTASKGSVDSQIPHTTASKEGAASELDRLVERYNRGDSKVTKEDVQKGLEAHVEKELTRFGLDLGKDQDGRLRNYARELARITLVNFDGEGLGGHSPKTGKVSIAVGKELALLEVFPSKVASHEIRHFMNTVERTALKLADPEGFKKALVEDVLHNVGHGGIRVSKSAIPEPRIQASPEEAQAMRGILRKYLASGSKPGELGQITYDAGFREWMTEKKINFPPDIPENRRVKLVSEMVGEIEHAHYVMDTSVLNARELQKTENAKLNELVQEKAKSILIEDVLHNVGHGGIRVDAESSKARMQASAEETQAMREIVRKYLASGSKPGELGHITDDAGLKKWMSENKLSIPQNIPEAQRDKIVSEMVGEIRHAHFVKNKSALDLEHDPNMAKAMRNRSADTNALVIKEFSKEGENYYLFSVEEAKARRQEFSAHLRTLVDGIKEELRGGPPEAQKLLQEVRISENAPELLKADPNYLTKIRMSRTLDPSQERIDKIRQYLPELRKTDPKRANDIERNVAALEKYRDQKTIHEYLPELKKTDPARAARIEQKLADLEEFKKTIRFNNAIQEVQKNLSELRDFDDARTRVKAEARKVFQVSTEVEPKTGRPSLERPRDQITDTPEQARARLDRSLQKLLNEVPNDPLVARQVISRLEDWGLMKPEDVIRRAPNEKVAWLAKGLFHDDPKTFFRKDTKYPQVLKLLEERGIKTREDLLGATRRHERTEPTQPEPHVKVPALEQSRPVTIGSKELSANSDLVSPEHVKIVRNNKGDLLIRDNNSEKGTFIKRAGSESFEPVKATGWEKITPDDEIRLGSPSGPQLRFAQEAEPKVYARAPHERTTPQLDQQAASTQVDRPAASMPRERADEAVGPRPAIGDSGYQRGSVVEFNGEKRIVAGFDRISGDVILRQPGIGRNSAVEAMHAPENLATDPNFRKFQIGKETYYRDLRSPGGKIYKYLESQFGDPILLKEPELRAVPRDRVSLPANQAERQETPPGSNAEKGAEKRAIIPPEHEKVPVSPTPPREFYLNGKKLTAGPGEMVIGREHQREAFNPYLHTTVSREHAVLRHDSEGRLFVKDISSNGTFKQQADGTWERLPKGQEVEVKASDRIRLGGEHGAELNLSGKDQPAQTSRPKPGSKVEFEGAKYFVSGYDRTSGDIILVRPGHGAYFAKVPRDLTSDYSKLQVGKETYYRNRDGAMFRLEGPQGKQKLVQDHEIRVVPRGRLNEILDSGKQAPEKIPASAQGERAVGRQMSPEEVRRRLEGEHLTMFLDRRTIAEPEAIRQTNEMALKHEISEHLRDGFQLSPYEGHGVGGDGRSRVKYSPDIVVDRTQDKILNKTIAEAHSRFDHLKGDPAALATELSKFAKASMHPNGWTEQALDAAYDKFNKDFAGKRMMLGEIMNRAQKGEFGGVCAQQALLLKVLGDSFGLETKLVYGHSGYKGADGKLPKNAECNHAWTEMKIGNKWQIFDPRQQVYGSAAETDRTHHHIAERKVLHNVREITPINQRVSEERAGKASPGEGSLERADLPESIRAGKIGQESEIPSALGLDLKPNDKVKYLNDGEWRVAGYNDKTGNMVLVRDHTRNTTAQELLSLNPRENIKLGGIVTIRSLETGQPDPGWELVGKDGPGIPRVFKKDGYQREVSLAELVHENPHLVREKSPPEPLPTDLGAIDQSQMAFQQGRIELKGKLQGQLGSEHLAMNAELTHPNGTTQEAIFHRTDIQGQAGVDVRDRFRKEQAIYKLNQLLGFENGFPVTIPRDVNMLGKTAKGYLQEKVGVGFVEELKKSIIEQYGQPNKENLSKLLNDRTELGKAAEQALVERFIYGCNDNVAGNWRAMPEGQQLKIQNIDLDQAFRGKTVPELVNTSSDKNVGMSRWLINHFAGRELSPDTLGHLRSFVERFDSPAGEKCLASSGITEGEAREMLSRARWFVENGSFPELEARQVPKPIRSSAPNDISEGGAIPIESGEEEQESFEANEARREPNEQPSEERNVDVTKLAAGPMSAKQLAAIKEALSKLDPEDSGWLPLDSGRVTAMADGSLRIANRAYEAWQYDAQGRLVEEPVRAEHIQRAIEEAISAPASEASDSTAFSWHLNSGEKLDVSLPSLHELLTRPVEELKTQFQANMQEMAALVANVRDQLPILAFHGTTKSGYDHTINAETAPNLWMMSLDNNQGTPQQFLDNLAGALSAPLSYTDFNKTTGNRRVEAERGPIMVFRLDQLPRMKSYKALPDMFWSQEHSAGQFQERYGVHQVVGLIEPAKYQHLNLTHILPESVRNNQSGLRAANADFADRDQLGLAFIKQALVLDALKQGGILGAP